MRVTQFDKKSGRIAVSIKALELPKKRSRGSVWFDGFRARLATFWRALKKQDAERK